MLARYQIQRLPFNGEGMDDFNNKIESWGEPVPVKIIGLNPATSDESGENHNRLSVERVMLVPRGFQANSRDRFTGLPNEGSRVFEAIGVPDFGSTPFTSWNFGGKLKVRCVSG